MKAFILCGGEGTRLRPYTYTTPKPMLPVGGKPILQHLIEHLKKHAIKEFALTVGYLKEKIMDYFEDGKKFGVKIEYATEDTPKNTAGSILDYRGKVKETFAVLMGDHITDINLADMIRSHKKSKAIATVALLKKETKIEYGVAEIDRKTGRITEFSEKPVIEHDINTGIYIFEPQVFDFIEEKDDFAKQVFPRLLKAGKPINAYVAEFEWLDIGRIADYERVKQEWKGKNR
ncbi:TPA: nucleotidyltransferase family protein [Candidatus Micrarchaeota archaeon]|nr:nucleotidyltransferase family protein [Candidatus Micrarchaeota archaeon]